MGEGMARVHHAPAHRRGARPVVADKSAGVAARIIVQNIRDVALLPKLDGAGLVAGGQGKSHAGEKNAQLIRLRVGEFDKLEPIGSGGVFGADHGFRGIVREGTHGKLHIQFA